MLSPEVQASLVAGRLLGRTSFYFGCWNRIGHFLHDINGNTFYSSDWSTGLPWGLPLVDGGLLKNGKIKDIPDGKVYWTCGGKDAFWYAFYWWDRSVDSRPNSNSGLYVKGFEHPSPQEAFDYACSQFPNVVQRQNFPLALQVDWRGASV